MSCLIDTLIVNKESKTPTLLWYINIVWSTDWRKISPSKNHKLQQKVFNEFAVVEISISNFYFRTDQRLDIEHKGEFNYICSASICVCLIGATEYESEKNV